MIGLLRAISKRDSAGQTWVEGAHLPLRRQRRAQGAPRLEINPDDADVRGLSDGQQVVLKNDLGRVHSALHVTDSIRPGVVALAGKWWSLPAQSSALTNLLVDSTLSPGGQPAYNDTFVYVESAI